MLGKRVINVLTFIMNIAKITMCEYPFLRSGYDFKSGLTKYNRRH